MDDVEAGRLSTLRGLGVLDSPKEERFDRVVRLAQRVFDVPMAAVTLIDEDRQWAKAHAGIPQELPRADAFCTHTVQRPDSFVVPDTYADDRFRDNPLVTGDPGIRFYAGHPLSAGGHRVGALCIIDDKPRHVSQSDLDLLRDLAAWVEKELTLDRELLQAGEMQRRLLPRRSPDLAGYEVAGRGLPARDVGGDFFDWYLAGPDLQLVLADVMGKGLGAAILAASVRAVIRGASRFNPLREAVSRAAYSLEPDLAETATFVTLFCARLAGDTGELEFIDAGHGLSLVLGQDGSSRRLHTGDLPLGVLPEQPWRLGRTTLRPGDTLVAVSDGFLDFFDDTSTALARLTALCRDSGSAQEMVDRMSDLARQQVPTDDITVVVVRRRDDTAG